MSPGEDAESDHIDILLQSRVRDHLRRLEETGVDRFHPGIAQSANQ